MSTLADYRKTLAILAPSVLGPDPEVYLTEVGFRKLLHVLEKIRELDVEIEIDAVTESGGNISIRYRTSGRGADRVAELIAALQ